PALAARSERRRDRHFRVAMHAEVRELGGATGADRARRGSEVGEGVGDVVRRGRRAQGGEELAPEIARVGRVARTKIEGRPFEAYDALVDREAKRGGQRMQAEVQRVVYAADVLEGLAGFTHQRQRGLLEER